MAKEDIESSADAKADGAKMDEGGGEPEGKKAKGEGGEKPEGKKAKGEGGEKPEGKKAKGEGGEKPEGKKAKGEGGEKPEGKKAKGEEKAEGGEKAEGKKAKGEGSEKAEGKKAKGGDKGEEKAEGGEKAEGKKAKGEGGEKAEGKKAEGKGGKKKGKAEGARASGSIKRAKPPRLQDKYRTEIVPALMKEYQYSTVMQVPRLQKITVNMGLGEAIANPKLVEGAVEQLEFITGQKPVITLARKSIATFKLRQGMKIGAMVTLRRERMYEFLDRLVSFALPRVRDFKGTSPKAFDGRGNYTLGIREQIIFPEVEYDKIEKIKGLNITFVTTARTDEEGRSLLRALGMPFRK